MPEYSTEKLRAVGELIKNTFVPIWNRPNKSHSSFAFVYLNVPLASLWATLISEAFIFPCTKSQFQIDLKVFNQTEGSKITIMQLLKRGWVRHINGEIILAEVTRSSVSLQSVYERVSGKLNEHDQLALQFLSQWKAKQLFGLYVSSQQLKTLLKPYKIFGVTPEWLKKHDILRQEEGQEEYQINSSCGESLSSVEDEVFAILVNSYAGGVDSVEKLRDFLRRIIRTEAFWPCKRNKYLNNERLKSLVDLSMELLNGESDLLNSHNEVSKAFFDCEGWKHHNLFDQPPKYQFTANEHYELIEQVELFEWYYHELFSGQDARNQYSFLLRFIVASEDRIGSEFHVTRSLIHDCTRPFIVYELLDICSYIFPHIIPLLILEESTAATAFHLLNEINWELTEAAQKREDDEANIDEPEWLRATRANIESVDEVWRQLFNIYLNLIIEPFKKSNFTLFGRFFCLR